MPCSQAVAYVCELVFSVYSRNLVLWSYVWDKRTAATNCLDSQPHLDQLSHQFSCQCLTEGACAFTVHCTLAVLTSGLAGRQILSELPTSRTDCWCASLSCHEHVIAVQQVGKGICCNEQLLRCMIVPLLLLVGFSRAPN